MSDEEVELVTKTNLGTLADDLTEWLAEYFWAHVSEQAQTDEFYEELNRVSDHFVSTFKEKLL